jgi:hypothetical protein
MNYGDMTPEMKRAYGFIQLTKEQVAFMTHRIKRMEKNSKSIRLMPIPSEVSCQRT